MPPFLKMFSSDKTVIRMALAYSYRAFLFSPVIALTLVYEKLFQAVGKMKVSMFCMMCGFVANIILDPLMIFGIGIFPAMGISGAAYAPEPARYSPSSHTWSSAGQTRFPLK